MLSVSGSVETTLTPLPPPPPPPFRGGEECKNVAVRVCELAFVGKSRRMEISRQASSTRRARTLLGSVADVVSRRWSDRIRTE